MGEAQPDDCSEVALKALSMAERAFQQRDTLAAHLGKVLREIKAFHGTFDARIYVEAERALKAAKGE